MAYFQAIARDARGQDALLSRTIEFIALRECPVRVDPVPTP